MKKNAISQPSHAKLQASGISNSQFLNFAEVFVLLTVCFMKNVTTSEKYSSRLFHENERADTISKRKLIILRKYIEFAAALIHIRLADLFWKT